MSLYSICMVPVPVDIDTYLGNSCEYMQMHVQYPYIAVLLDSYFPLMGLWLELCTQIGVVYYCENMHLPRHRSNHTCASAI